MSYFSTAILVALTIQRSGSGILLHEAGHLYSTGLAVLLGELLKLSICTTVAIYQLKQNIRLQLPVSREQQHDNVKTASSVLPSHDSWQAYNLFAAKVFTREAWRILLPAALYVVQNNLYLYSSGRLQPSTFQVS